MSQTAPPPPGPAEPDPIAAAAPVDEAAASTAVVVIESLPPIVRTAPGGHPVSPRTGEPQRPVLVGIASGLLYAGSVVASAGALKALWDAVSDLTGAARMFRWAHLTPVSWQTVVLVLAAGLITVVVAGSASVIAYNAWNGHRWVRVGGVIALGISGLSYLLNTPMMFSIPAVGVGTALLWLPRPRRYFAAWHAIRHPVPPQPDWRDDVQYGPLPRYVSAPR